MSIFRRFAIVLLLLCAAPSAFAACTDQSGGLGTAWICDEQGEAFAKAQSIPVNWCGSSYDRSETVIINPTNPKQYLKRYTYSGCGKPAGYTATAGSASFNTSTDCAGKPPISGKAVLGAATACHEGCGYTMGGSNAVCLGNNEYCFASTWNPTGQFCSEGPGFKPDHDPNKEVCKTTGNYVHCVNAAGKQCVTSARGTRMCWSPGETGTRMTADGMEGAARTVNGTPPQPPTGMENPTQTSSQSTTINNSTYNSTTYSGTGNNGGQPNTGDGGNDGGQAGDGDGNGNGDDGQDEGDDYGAPGGQGDALYTPGEKTVETVFAAYGARISEAPIVAAVAGFFDVSVGGGNCPVWTMPESQWLPAFTFDLFCSGILTLLLEAAGIVMLIVAARYAFHIAIGD